MQEFLALEAWVILVAAPCVLSWVLGEMHGAARMRSIASSGTAATDGTESMWERIGAPERALRIQTARAEASLQARRIGNPQSTADMSKARASIDSAMERSTSEVREEAALAASRNLTSPVDDMSTPDQLSEEAEWRRREIEQIWAERDAGLVEDTLEATQGHRALAEERTQANAQEYIDQVLAAFAPPLSEVRTRRDAPHKTIDAKSREPGRELQPSQTAT